MEDKGLSVEAKKVEDLERKMQVLVEQMDEERTEIHYRLEHMTERVICMIGGRLSALKHALAHFILESSKKIDKLGRDVTTICSK